MLYDPAQATKQETPRRRRATTSITTIAWPVSCVPILQAYANLTQIRSYRHEAENTALQHLWQDIVRIAASLQAFTRDEIEAMGGGVLDLTMPPTLIRRVYLRRDASQDEQTTLLSRIMTAYRNSQRTQNSIRED
jgi:hypothetical protein